MANFLPSVSYVSEDGNFGTGKLLTFNSDELTEAQWELVEILSDRDKIQYVFAALNGHSTTEWED